MKKLVLLFLAGVAALVAVLVVRALTFESRQPSAPPAAPLAALDVDGAARALSAAVRVPTVSHQDGAGDDPAQFAVLHAVLEKAFPRVHATLERTVLEGGSLLFTWRGSDKARPATVLMAHQDVVPVDPADAPQWTEPPFEGRIKDGFIWGRGSIDDKSGVVTTLAAVEALLAENFVPRGDVLLAFAHDEEVLGKGAPMLRDEILRRGHKVDLVMDEGLVMTDGILPGLPMPMAVIGVSQKGYLTVELLAEVDGGHSSMPAAESAVGVLSRAVAALEKNPLPVHVGGPAAEMLEHAGAHMTWPLRLVFANLWLFRPVVRGALLKKPSTAALLRTTTAPTVLEAGVKENVVPRTARALVNFRIHPLDTVEGVLAHVESTIGDARVKVRALPGNRGAMRPSPTDDAVFRTVQSAFAAVEPRAITGPGLVVGATDARHFENVTPHVYMFRPTRMTTEDTRRIHGINERLHVDDLSRAIRFYAELLRRVSAAP